MYKYSDLLQSKQFVQLCLWDNENVLYFVKLVLIMYGFTCIGTSLLAQCLSDRVLALGLGGDRFHPWPNLKVLKRRKINWVDEIYVYNKSVCDMCRCYITCIYFFCFCLQNYSAIKSYSFDKSIYKRMFCVHTLDL